MFPARLDARNVISLTERELVVLAQMAEGRSNHAIASHLHMPARTEVARILAAWLTTLHGTGLFATP
jgi:DNA-binding NarL/FixJ family response regulator